jgi:FMN-dependent NADH-azoreductase
MGAYSIVDPPLSERRSNRLRNSNVDFGLLYKLKHLIDLVAQRNYLFTYDGKQYGPLLNVEKAIVVYTRGFTFPVGYSYTALAIRSPSNLFGLWLLVDVRDLRSMIVDNAWNRGGQESEVSLAKGKATLEQLVECFLASS